MIPDTSPEHTGLVMLFRVDDPEQAQAFDGYRRAFGAGATCVEVLDENTRILHVYAGVCSHGDAT